MNRGDIIIVAPWPPFAKPRPAVVIQARIFDVDENVTIALVTSDLARTTANRILVQPSALNRLRKPSEIMLDLIMTVPLERIGGYAGTMERDIMLRVDAALRLFLAL